MMKLARITAWSLAIVIVFLTMCPPGIRPVTELPHDTEHAVIFGVTGLAFSLGYPNRLATILWGAIASTMLLELAQALVPGRHSRFSDFVVDAIAASLGAAIGASRPVGRIWGAISGKR